MMLFVSVAAILLLGFTFFMFITTCIASCISNATTSSTTKKVGLNEATLVDIRKLLYSQAKLHEHRDSAACSICLGDYKETDEFRMLPECGHLFHLKCVDPWLRLNPTCPICRNSPMGTSRANPVAEAATLRILMYDL